MKNMKTRIAAAACAALTAICGAQALSASAFNYGHPYTTNTQDWCENPQNMSYNLHAWQSYGYSEGSSWSTSVKAGTCVGKGFSSAHISSYNVNQNLFNQISWVRYLAASHFGMEPQKAVWLELPKTDFPSYGYYTIGDQIFLKATGEVHAVFLTSFTGNTFTCSEVRSGKVRWGVKYQRLSSYKFKRMSDGKVYDLSYVARPIKEGDATGDGTVNLNDVIWLEQNYGSGIITSTNRDALMAAADVSGNWWLDVPDRDEIYAHAYQGRMVGDYRYVLAQW